MSGRINLNFYISKQMFCSLKLKVKVRMHMSTNLKWLQLMYGQNENKDFAINDKFPLTS
jgi:hypothetical protein